MRGNELLDKLELIDPAYIEAADAKPKKKMLWVSRGALAACLCLAAMSVMLFIPDNSRSVLKWSESFRPESYFKYNQSGNDTDLVDSIDISAIPYADSRDFSDYRSRMEADNIIPEMPEHPLFSCTARYNEDDSIYSVSFSWHQRGESYSDLTIVAGYQEIESIEDCIAVEIDENGNIVSPSVTVTERDGIRITAKGSINSRKTLTFRNETAWYQIIGSWGDSYESMAELLDWVWEHPIEFDLFTIDKGAEIINSDLEAYPGAFAEYIPDFQAFGYFLGDNSLRLKDGIPYRYEGHYYTGIDEAKVEDGSYLFEEGWSEIHWCIDTEPDYYDLQDCLGDISGLSLQLIADTLTEKSHISFMLEDCFIKVYGEDANEVWAVVESLM